MCLILFSYQYFIKGKVFHIDKVQFLNFFHLGVMLLYCIENSSTNPRSHRFSPVFSSGSLIAVHFTVRSMIHFEFVLLKVLTYYPVLEHWSKGWEGDKKENLVRKIRDRKKCRSNLPIDKRSHFQNTHDVSLLPASVTSTLSKPALAWTIKIIS